MGKGYTLMEGYKITPIMFSESQANALILAEQLVLKNKDTSFIKDYTEAIENIKAVLPHSKGTKPTCLPTELNLSRTLTEKETAITSLNYNTR